MPVLGVFVGITAGTYDSPWTLFVDCSDVEELDHVCDVLNPGLNLPLVSEDNTVELWRASLVASITASTPIQVTEVAPRIFKKFDERPRVLHVAAADVLALGYRPTTAKVAIELAKLPQLREHLARPLDKNGMRTGPLPFSTPLAVAPEAQIALVLIYLTHQMEKP